MASNAQSDSRGFGSDGLEFIRRSNCLLSTRLAGTQHTRLQLSFVGK